MEARSGSCKPGTFTSGQVGRTPGSVSGCAVYCAHPAPPVPCLPGFSPGAPDHLTTQQVEGGGTGVWGVRAGPGISLTLPCFSPSRCWRVPKGTSMAISVPGQADPQGWTVWPAGGPQKMAVWCTGSPGGWREGASDTLTCRCQVGGGGGARGGGLPCHRVTPCWASRCWPFSPERKRLGPAGPVGVDRRWGRSFRLPGPGRWWAGRPASGLRVSRCRRRSAGPTCCLSQPSRPHCALRLGRTHLPFLCPPVPSTSVHLLGPGSERL